MLPKKKLFILTIAILWYGNSLAQIDYDTTSPIYQKIKSITALSFKSSEDAIQMAHETMNESVKIHNYYLTARSKEALGWASFMNGKWDSSIYYLNSAKAFFKEKHFYEDLLNTNLELAEVFNRQSRYSEALQCLLEADSLGTDLKKINEPYLQWLFGVVYRGLSENNKAKEFFTKSMNGYLKNNDTVKYINTGVSLAILYRNNNHFDSSLQIVMQSLKLANKGNIPIYNTAMIHEGVAESFLGLGQQKKDKSLLDSALTHYLIAYKIFSETNNGYDKMWEAYCIGRTLTELNRFKEAETYFMEAYHYAKEKNMLNHQLDFTRGISHMFEKAGNFKNASYFLKLSNTISDSLNILAQTDKANELKEKYETEKKEQEIKFLKSQQELSLIKSNRIRMIQFGIIILLGVLITLVLVLLNRQKIKRKLEVQILRNQLAADLHDDVGSALSSINISSRLALTQQGDTHQVEAHLKKINNQVQKTLENMSDIVWSINPEKDTLNDIIVRMREFAYELCDPLNIRLDFQVNEDVKTAFPPDARRNLFLIFKEAINNAAKYSSCKNIIVKIESNNKELNIKVTDDGIGFDEINTKPGNGLNNMRARAAHLSAGFDIESGIGRGTSIILSYPYIGV